MNYGKLIRLAYDGEVYHVSPIEKTKFRLVNGYGEYLYPQNVTYGENKNEVYLWFENFNNIVYPVSLECIGTIAMGSPDLSFDPFVVEIWPRNLRPIPGSNEHLSISSVDAFGEIGAVFDGKMYSNEFLSIASVSSIGTVNVLVFKSGYLQDGYLSLAATVVSGTVCDVNGVPI